MKRKINMAIVGYGHRSPGMLSLLMEMDDVNIVGISDTYEDRAIAGGKAVVDAGRKAPLVSTDYRRLLDIPKLDAVFTPSSSP